MGKLSFLAGAAAGYVLGARAGTQRYEQIKTQANKLWSSDPVQTKVSQATDAAKTKAAPFVADVVSDAAKTTDPSGPRSSIRARRPCPLPGPEPVPGPPTRGSPSEPPIQGAGGARVLAERWRGC